MTRRQKIMIPVVMTLLFLSLLCWVSRWLFEPSPTPEPHHTATATPTPMLPPPTWTPTPALSLQSCRLLMQVAQASTGAQWQEFQKETVGRRADGWRVKILRVEKEFLGAWPVVSNLVNDDRCAITWSATDKDEAVGYTIGQETIVTGTVQSVRRAFGRIIISIIREQ